MSNHNDIFHDIGEGLVIGGAVGLGVALLGMIFGSDPKRSPVDEERKRLELALLQAQIDKVNRS